LPAIGWIDNKSPVFDAVLAFTQHPVGDNGER
jgi:hypothetical protein